MEEGRWDGGRRRRGAPRGCPGGSEKFTLEDFLVGSGLRLLEMKFFSGADRGPVDFFPLSQGNRINVY